MNRIKQLMKILDIKEKDALIALLGSFGPPQACGTRGYWLRHDHYGKSAPSTADLKSIYRSNDYKCVKCRSQRGLSIDHKNGDSKDHRLTNLELLCKSCNRGKSTKPTVDKDHKLKIYISTVELFQEKNSFPTNSEIKSRAGVQQIGGVSDFLGYLKSRLEKSNKATCEDARA